ncbi:MAG: serine hydrolase [Chloroflexi bacterium]|nr:serine hydrolase [Chloroflexota bacterium]
MSVGEVAQRVRVWLWRRRWLVLAAVAAVSAVATVGAAAYGLTIGQGSAAPAASDLAASERLPVIPSHDGTGREPSARPGDERPELGPEGPVSEAPPEVAATPENVDVAADLRGLLGALRDEIEAYSAQVGGIDVAIAVTDLQTGETISIDGNVLHRSACTINMFALYAATDLFQAGAARPEDVAYSIRIGIGDSYPPEVKNFLQALFGSHETGVAHARKMMRAWGLRNSVFDHVPYYGDGTQSNYLTALETNLVLTNLYRGRLFNPEWTAYAISVLRDIAPYLNYILPGQLPYGAVVAHKMGYFWDYDGWVNNDAGIVTFTDTEGRTRAYVISYLSQQAATEYAGYSFGAHLSRVVWDYFAARYGAAASGPAPVYNPPAEPEATPEPTATSTPKVTATPKPTPKPTPKATATSTPKPKPTATATPVPSPELTPSPTPD